MGQGHQITVHVIRVFQVQGLTRTATTALEKHNLG